MNADNAIEVKNLSKSYFLFNKDFRILQWIFTKKGYEKERAVLKDISFEVRKGEIVGLIGVNGAGKSTLMKLIAGITYPSSGSVEVNAPADFVIFNPDELWTVKEFASKSTNTPFTGAELYGKIYYTICGGEVVYKN